MSLAKVISGELNLAHLCKIAIAVLVLCVVSRVDPKIIQSQPDHNHKHTKMREAVASMSPLPAPAALLSFFMAALPIALLIGYAPLL